MISTLAASSMRRARHHVLIFHRVMEEPDPMSPDDPTAAWFSRLLRMLTANFEMISLTEAMRRLQADSLQGRTASVTFDDGYADNFTVALPVLEKFQVPATFFVASGFIGGGRMWNDSIIETFRRIEPGVCEVELEGRSSFDLKDWESRRKAAAATILAWKHLPPDERQARVDDFAGRASGLPTGLMMSKQQLRQLADSPCASIGGHTRNHPILAAVPDAEALSEIEGGKRDLEEWLQTEVQHFAYPNGRFGTDYRARHAELVKQAGFSAALATDWGTLGADSDLYAIPRFTPWQRHLPRFSIDLARCHYGLI